jgi:hypothetical protein
VFPKLEYEQTKSGCLKLLLDGYGYTYHTTNKDDTKYWICYKKVNNVRCNAAVKTKDMGNGTQGVRVECQHKFDECLLEYSA